MHNLWNAIQRKDNFQRHMRRQHPMMCNTNSCAENLDFTVNNENNVEHSTMPQASNQTGGGQTAYETNDCITEDEAINGNLKVYDLPALDKTKFDPQQFFHSKYEKLRKF